MKIYLVGRDSTCDIVVADDSVSRNHLQLAVEDNGSCRIVDLDSTNGTYVNGIRIRENVPLKEGDEVRIGNIKLEWEQYIGKSGEKKNWRLRVGIVSICVISMALVIVFVKIIKSTHDEDIENREKVKKLEEKLRDDEKTLCDAYDKTLKRLEEEKDIMRKNVEESKGEVAKTKRALHVANQKVQKAKEEKEAADKKTRDADKRAQEAKVEADEKIEEFNRKVQEAEEEKANALKEKEATEQSFGEYLKKEFEDLSKKLNSSMLAFIASKMGKDRLTTLALREEFYNSDNMGKVKINRVIREALENDSRKARQTEYVDTLGKKNFENKGIDNE